MHFKIIYYKRNIPDFGKTGKSSGGTSNTMNATRMIIVGTIRQQYIAVFPSQAF
jgi:hypothetical protein